MSSFGEELRRERELREITLREISEATKISLRYLDALENNDFRHLPGGVFNKGFVRAFAQYIGVDPETMVNAYLLEARGQQPSGAEGLESDVFRPPSGSPVRSSSDPSGATPSSRLWIVVLGAVVVAALATALGWWWWTTSTSAARPSADSESVRQGSMAIVPAAPDAETADSEPDPAGAADDADAAEQAPPTDTVTPATLKADSATRLNRPPVATRHAADEFRVVVQRPTQGRLNCDNRRVEILDGLTAGTELVLRCRSFLMVDALDGGALLVQQGHSEATTLAADGVPVMSRYPVPPKESVDVEEPS